MLVIEVIMFEMFIVFVKVIVSGPCHKTPPRTQSATAIDPRPTPEETSRCRKRKDKNSKEKNGIGGTDPIL